MSILDELSDTLEEKREMTKDDLTEFIAGLSSSLLAEPDRWENLTLEDFLESWAAWLGSADPDALKEYSESHSEWNFIARMLRVVVTYE